MDPKGVTCTAMKEAIPLSAPILNIGVGGSRRESLRRYVNGPHNLQCYMMSIGSWAATDVVARWKMLDLQSDLQSVRSTKLRS